MYKRFIKTVCFLCVVTLSSNMFADNAKANVEFSQGVEALKAKKFKKAASFFNAAELYADDAVTKSNAIKAAAKSYRYANLLFHEFEEIEKLLGGYPSHVDFEKLVTREFEIGEKYFDGYREQEYKFFTWVKGEDKTVDIYEKAVSRGPFAAMAPKAKLRLGRIYLKDGKRKKALAILDEVATAHQGAPEQKYGYLELGNALMQMARISDGDGANAKRAKEVLSTILKKYPEDDECVWVKGALKEIDEIAAKRLHGVAAFYKRTGKEEVAQTYLKQVVRDYPDTKAAESSEEVLVELDSTFVPQVKEEKKELSAKQIGEQIKSLMKTTELTANPQDIEMVPENSGGRWLLPIKKLDPQAEKVVSEEELERERRAIAAKLAAEKRKKAKEALRKIVQEEKRLAEARAALEETLAQNKEIHKRLKGEFSKRKAVEGDVKGEVAAFDKVAVEIAQRLKVPVTEQVKKAVTDKELAVTQAENAVKTKKDIISDIMKTDKVKVAAQKQAKTIAAKAPTFDLNEEVSLLDPDKVIARLKAMEDTRENILSQLTEQQKVLSLAKSEVVGEQKAFAAAEKELKARKEAVRFAKEELEARIAAEKKAAEELKKKEQARKEAERKKAELKKLADQKAEAARKEAAAKAAEAKAKTDVAPQAEKSVEKKVVEKKTEVVSEPESGMPVGVIVVIVIALLGGIGAFIKFRKKA